MSEQHSRASLVLRFRKSISIAARTAFRRLPLPHGTKDRLAGLIFRRMPFLVTWSTTYKNWQAEQRRIQQQQAALSVLEGGEGARPRYRERSDLERPRKLLARAIAFYLPQFHPIPENDEWWGKGFTEWTNVRRATPQFEGHRQPRRPGEFGYYNLIEQPNILRRQALLAHQYGLEGFCFYFYWFNGKRLLERPIELYAEDAEITFPFCLCWANESWSRRWDGREDLQLIVQSHSPEDDIAFIEYVSRYLSNPKYIRIDGRPLLLVYRPGLLPDPGATAQRWRNWCRQNGVGEIYIAFSESFDKVNPSDIGFDASVEFPPNNMGLEPEPDLVDLYAPTARNKVYRWTDLVTASEEGTVVRYKRFRGVTPQWDNTARKMDSGAIFCGESPTGFERWVRSAAEGMKRNFDNPQERILFVNAWNEWAEGAYLEPDQEYGYAWLEAIRNGLVVDRADVQFERRDLVPAAPQVLSVAERKIIVVVHDLNVHGAQLLSLGFVSTLSEKFGYDVVTIACAPGPLLGRFQAYGDVVQIGGKKFDGEELEAILTDFAAKGFNKAIVNSSAAGWIASYLSQCGISCLGLVHELPGVIHKMKLDSSLQTLNEHADSVVFASDFVRKRIEEACADLIWKNPVILPQGLYKRDGIARLSEKEFARKALIDDLDLSDDSRFVVGVGFGDKRKGVDTFCKWAVAAASADPTIHFVWVGNLAPDMSKQCQALLQKSVAQARNVHFVGFRQDTSGYYRAADAYVMTSREDPYPSTALEALDCGTPVFFTSGTSGIEDLVASGVAVALRTDGAGEFARELQQFLHDEDHAKRLAERGLDVTQANFGFLSFVGDVLRLLGEPIPKISVIVPSYNYEAFLPARLDSILNQALPVWEIIFIDDHSADDSVCVAREFLKNAPINYRIIESATNSGSVFAQWKKGVELARGELVWIAEADDWAARNFTQTVSKPFMESDTVLSYAQSNQVDDFGRILCPDYLEYVSDIDSDRWRFPYISPGEVELAEGLSVKNTIPNVSGVLFRREELTSVLTDQFEGIRKFRVAGDWYVYAFLAKLGAFAFHPSSLNYHRRHHDSVTISRFTRSEWNEIRQMQELVRSMTSVSEEMTACGEAYLNQLEGRLGEDAG